MKSAISWVASCLLLAILITVLPGCKSGPDLREVYSTNIKKLHACYVMYMEDHGYVGPNDEAELKEYLKTDPTAIHLIKRVDLTPDDIDGLFISDRDGQPFVIRYGLSGEADHAIVFEAEGVEGMRLVALADVMEYDSQEYEGYLSGKIKPETVDGSGAETFDEEATDSEPTSAD